MDTDPPQKIIASYSLRDFEQRVQSWIDKGYVLHDRHLVIAKSKFSDGRTDDAFIAILNKVPMR